jgi:putative oxidoreductase
MNQQKNKVQLGARITLGLIFSVFGLNGFLNFLPQPAHPGPAGAFLGALAMTGYMFPLIKATELVAGLLLLAGRAVPFALTLLAPVVVNIVAFHLFFEPATLALPLFTLAAGLYLAWTERAVFAPLFAARRAPEKRVQERAGGHAVSAA